jgi:hypothetical protein
MREGLQDTESLVGSITSEISAQYDHVVPAVEREFASHSSNFQDYRDRPAFILAGRSSIRRSPDSVDNASLLAYELFQQLFYRKQALGILIFDSVTSIGGFCLFVNAVRAKGSSI